MLELESFQHNKENTMVKEIFTKNSKQIAINVTQSKIDSIRKKNIKKTN